MDTIKDTEYIFWLEFWRKGWAPWPNVGHYKCVVNKERIWIIPIEKDIDKKTVIHIQAIQKCRLGYSSINYWQVILFMNEGSILLGPIHPIDPSGIQNINYHEASALIKTIDAFRSGEEPGISPNPYTRQLAEKNNLKGFVIPDIRLDKHTSPWSYYKSYGPKFLRARISIKNILLLTLMVTIVVLLVLGVSFILDILNVI